MDDIFLPPRNKLEAHVSACTLFEMYNWYFKTFYKNTSVIGMQLSFQCAYPYKPDSFLSDYEESLLSEE